ncbi:MAG: hypothetical protein ACLQVW_00890, partial [Limisphaerales bacterium]
SAGKTNSLTVTLTERGIVFPRCRVADQAIRDPMIDAWPAVLFFNGSNMPVRKRVKSEELPTAPIR